MTLLVTGANKMFSLIERPRADITNEVYLTKEQRRNPVELSPIIS
jgi:hypothetical protein